MNDCVALTHARSDPAMGARVVEESTRWLAHTFSVFSCRMITRTCSTQTGKGGTTG